MIHFGKNVEKLKPLFIVGSIFKFFKAEIENKHIVEMNEGKNDCELFIRHYAGLKEQNIKGR